MTLVKFIITQSDAPCLKFHYFRSLAIQPNVVSSLTNPPEVPSNTTFEPWWPPVFEPITESTASTPVQPTSQYVNHQCCLNLIKPFIIVLCLLGQPRPLNPTLVHLTCDIICGRLSQSLCFSLKPKDPVFFLLIIELNGDHTQLLVMVPIDK